jgi:hypothetical protein
LVSVACGGDGRSPAAPSTGALLSLSGLVSDATSGAPLQGAALEIIDGPNLGRQASSGPDGAYRFDQLQASGFTIRVSRSGYQTQHRPVTLTSSQRLDVALPAADARRAGRAVDVLTGAPLAGLSVGTSPAGNVPSARTADDGSFVIAVDAPGVHPLTLSGTTVVARSTHIVVPGGEAIVTLIPATFDLAAFNQLCRVNGRLRRLTQPLALEIVIPVLQFTSFGDASYAVLGERLGGGDVDALVADLAWGLERATGQAYPAFAGVEQRSPVGSTLFFPDRTGATPRLSVARFAGLTAATGYWGYARWANEGDTVVARAILLDREFDASGSSFRRSLRVHELGHVLGYEHVTTESFMNPNGRIEPTAFDLDAARIAYRRPPGNQPPDADPAEFVIERRYRAGYTLRWGPPVP